MIMHETEDSDNDYTVREKMLHRINPQFRTYEAKLERPS